MTIGTRIAYLRKKQNLTQAELAALLFVSPKTISKWENGYGLPDVKILPELSKALGEDIDYLLTGVYPEQPQKTPPPAREKIADYEQKKGEYRLSLYQVTHNHLTKWVLFFNILVLIFALIGGPIDVVNEQGNGFSTLSILTAIYPPLGYMGVANGWIIAISVLWMATLLFIVTSTAVMISATLNGTNEYYVIVSAIQFGAVFLIGILAFVGSWLTNLFAGEIVMRLNILFLLLLACTFFQFVLNLLVSRHGKILHGLKQIAALGFVCLFAFSLTGAILPQKIVPTVLDESSVEIVEPDLTLTKREISGIDYSFTEIEGEGIMAVAANLKITFLYETKMRYFEGSEKKFGFFNADYLQTDYRNGKYYNFFRMKISITADTGHDVSDFSFEYSIAHDGKLYEFYANGVQYVNEFENDRIFYTYGNDLTFNLTFLQKTILRGFETSDKSELKLFFKKDEFENWKELAGQGANETIEVSMQKYEGAYQEVAFAQICVELLPRRSLFTALDVKVLTDSKPFGFRIRFEPEEIIKNYIKGLPK